jgi:hypothetical protein
MIDATKPPIPKYVEQSRVEVDGFTRIVSRREAFDLRGTEHANYGQGGVMYDYALVGPEGAINWRLSTGEYVNDAPGESHAGGVVSHLPDPDGGECDLLPGSKCSGDIGFLIGDEVFAALQAGEDEMWAKLLDIYNDWILKGSDDD